MLESMDFRKNGCWKEIKMLGRKDAGKDKDAGKKKVLGKD